MRVTADLYVSALRRRAESAGAFALVVHRGATEAGAVFIALTGGDGLADLYAPAPQYLIEDDGERRFERVAEGLSNEELNHRIDSERRFDSDLWLIEIEDREKRLFFEVVDADEA